MDFVKGPLDVLGFFPLVGTVTGTIRIIRTCNKNSQLDKKIQTVVSSNSKINHEKISKQKKQIKARILRGCCELIPILGPLVWTIGFLIHKIFSQDKKKLNPENSNSEEKTKIDHPLTPQFKEDSLVTFKPNFLQLLTLNKDHVNQVVPNVLDSVGELLVTDDELQALYSQFINTDLYKSLPSKLGRAFKTFFDTIQQGQIPRQDEVFKSDAAKQKYYRKIRAALKSVLNSLALEKELPQVKLVLQELEFAVGQCPLAYANQIVRALLHQTKQAEKEWESDILENDFLRILGDLRFEILNQMANEYGRRESHTLNGLFCRIGRSLNIPGVDFLDIEDKQDDLKGVSIEDLKQRFYELYTPKTILNWLSDKINQKKPCINHEKLTDALTPLGTDRSLKVNLWSELYGNQGGSAENLRLQPVCIAELLTRFKILTTPEPILTYHLNEDGVK